LKKRTGGQLSTKLFFVQAYYHFRKKFSDKKVVFIVGSDDYKWCHAMFDKMEGVTIADTAPKEIR
jgi:hypothetical protein